MDLILLADGISLSVFFVVLISLIGNVIGAGTLLEKFQYCSVILGSSVFIVITTALLKSIIPSKRPACAKNCDVFNMGGDASFENGMPSGHMTMATFLVVFLYPYPVSALWLLGVAWGRYYKMCHTIPQIIGGFLYGGLLGFVGRLLV